MKLEQWIIRLLCTLFSIITVGTVFVSLIENNLKIPLSFQLHCCKDIVYFSDVFGQWLRCNLHLDLLSHKLSIVERSTPLMDNCILLFLKNLLYNYDYPLSIGRPEAVTTFNFLILSIALPPNR